MKTEFNYKYYYNGITKSNCDYRLFTANVLKAYKIGLVSYNEIVAHKLKGIDMEDHLYDKHEIPSLLPTPTISMQIKSYLYSYEEVALLFMNIMDVECILDYHIHICRLTILHMIPCNIVSDQIEDGIITMTLDRTSGERRSVESLLRIYADQIHNLSLDVIDRTINVWYHSRDMFSTTSTSYRSPMENTYE